MEGKKLTALLVDDEVGSLDSLYWTLSPLVIIQKAENGTQAYEMILREKPGLLYTDVKMPIMAGDVLLEVLVKETIHIPTFVLTATPDNEQGIKAIYYSHRMYTPDQIERLNLPKKRCLKEQEAYINQLRTEPNPDYGFNVFVKPWDAKVVTSRTEIVLNMLDTP